MNSEALKQDNAGRIRAFQGARFLFVVFIYLSHCVSDNMPLAFDYGGDMGVSFFFVLSGFVLSWGYGPQVTRREFALKPFFWSHWVHLYPLHVLLFAAFWLLDSRIGHCYDATQVLSNLLLLQAWIPSSHTLYTLNAVSWFLGDTLFFYIVFPCSYRWLMRKSWKCLAGTFFLLAVIYVAVAIRIPDCMANCTLYANPLARWIDFASGICTYRLYKSVAICHGSVEWMMPKLPLLAKLTHCWRYIVMGRWMLLCDVVALVLLYFLHRQMGWAVRCAALFWLVMPLFILHLALQNGTSSWIIRTLSSRMMVWLGSLSFEFFMVHLLALRLLRHAMGEGAGLSADLFCFFLAFFLALVIAWLLCIAYVKPVSNVINSYLLR